MVPPGSIDRSTSPLPGNQRQRQHGQTFPGQYPGITPNQAHGCEILRASFLLNAGKSRLADPLSPVIVRRKLPTTVPPCSIGGMIPPFAPSPFKPPDLLMKDFPCVLRPAQVTRQRHDQFQSAKGGMLPFNLLPKRCRPFPSTTLQPPT